MNDEFSKHYTKKSFWRKLAGYAKTAGREVVEKALVLYYVGQDPDTPKWAKGIIAAALGYFVFPLDAIPDFTPLVGFGDDLGALVFALGAVAASIKKKHLLQAKAKIEEWFDSKKSAKPVPPSGPPPPLIPPRLT